MIKSSVGHINFIWKSKKYFYICSNLGCKHGTAYCLGILANGAETPCVSDNPSSWQRGFGEQLNMKHRWHTPNLSGMRTQLQHGTRVVLNAVLLKTLSTFKTAINRIEWNWKVKLFFFILYDLDHFSW